MITGWNINMAFLSKNKMLYSLWSNENNIALLNFRLIFCNECDKQGMLINDNEIVDCSCGANVWRCETKCFCDRPLLLHKLVNNKIVVYCNTCSIPF